MPKLKYLKVKPHDFDALAISALRYSIGRRSYITSWTADVIRAYRKFLHPKTVDVMIRDIVNAKSLGDEQIDQPHWVDLKNKLEELRCHRQEKKSS